MIRLSGAITLPNNTLKNAAIIQSWVISPFTGPPAVRAAIRTCMAGKRYTLEKADD
jgi:hypothetical protein